jgi:hypothetical protein
MRVLEVYEGSLSPLKGWRKNLKQFRSIFFKFTANENKAKIYTRRAVIYSSLRGAGRPNINLWALPTN